MNKADEVERLEYEIERLDKDIKQAKRLMDCHYSDNRLERYESLRDYKYQLESELEGLTEDCFDDDFDVDDYIAHRSRTYAPIEGFYYG